VGRDGDYDSAMDRIEAMSDKELLRAISEAIGYLHKPMWQTELQLLLAERRRRSQGAARTPT
jgi:hypothetical protein